MRELFSLGGRPPLIGCGLLIVHWTVLAVLAFPLTLLAGPVVAIVLGGVTSALGITLDIEIEIFYVIVPVVAILSVWLAGRINRWIDRTLGLPAIARPGDSPELVARLGEMDARLAPPTESGREDGPP